jgi:hypothetical protein
VTHARSAFVVLLLFIGAVFTVFANATVWANRTVFNTDNFVATTNRVLDDQQTQQQIATRLSTTLVDQGQVEQRLREDLPEGLKALAPLLTVTARNLADEAIVRLLQNDQARAGLDAALRGVHEQAMRIIEGEGAVLVQGNTIVLDLRTILRQAADQLNLDPNINLNLPPDAGQVTLVEDAKTAGAIQELLSLHNTITWAVVGIAVAAFALAVLVARERRVTLRTVGIVIVACALLAIVTLLPLRPIVAGFAQNPSAARATFDAFFRDYRVQSFILMLIGVAIILIAALLGQSELARAVRGSVRRAPGEPAPDLRLAIRDSATPLRVIGFVAGALVLAAWPQPNGRVYVTTFVLLAAYLAGLWLITSDGEWATRARERMSEAFGRVGGSGGERNLSFAGRHAGQLRLAGIVGGLIAIILVPDLGIGALAIIVALTLVYLALVDWLATRTGAGV